MGRTFTDVEVENYNDVVRREESGNGHERVRKLKVHALVDTGSALLCLHRDAIQKLGLIRTRKAKARTGGGVVDRPIYAIARIKVLGRWCSAEVMEIPDELPPLLGYILLEALDLVIQPKTHKVIPNPESGGKWVLDLLTDACVRRSLSSFAALATPPSSSPTVAPAPASAATAASPNASARQNRARRARGWLNGWRFDALHFPLQRPYRPDERLSGEQ